MVLDEPAAAGPERSEIRIGRIENGREFVVRELDITIEVQRVQIPFRILEHHVGEERIYQQCESADFQLPGASACDRVRPIARHGFGARRKARGDLRARPGVFRGTIDFSCRRDLRCGQAVRPVGALALNHGRIEAAKPRILD